MKYLRLYVQKTLRYLLKPLSFVPACCIMYLIFYMSAQEGTASASLSYKISLKLVTMADILLKKELDILQLAYYADLIHYYVRKLGHVIEYFALAASITCPLYVYRLRGFKLILFTGAFCVIFACLDEYHQSFVAGRGPSIKDVGIDSIGIFSGILSTQLVCYIGRKTIFAPLSKKT
ncbi:MAG: VanZ family protein [Lachnospiraceae bacterium]|nr:VanZ family protein [Lachnospiraceae bacterium]